MMLLMVLCWLLPIGAVTWIFGSLLTRNYESAIQQETAINVQNAFRELEIRLNSAIEDSKAISYDGVVRSSYRNYQLNGDTVELYNRVNEYLSQRFSRAEEYKAVFISFWNDIPIQSYVINPEIPTYATLRKYRSQTEPEILQSMASVETAIRFLVIDNDLYIARNILDAKFDPYATAVMLCSKDILFRAIFDLPGEYVTEVRIDGETILPENIPVPESDFHYESYDTEIDGHPVSITAAFPKFHIWRDVPSLKYGVLAASALGIPMLLIAVYFFYKQVTRPTAILLEGFKQAQSGKRGYLIKEQPNNREFRELVTHFNSMSTELKNQFDQLYQEQQALQQAKIRTLQSQINPHFLNNTLEVINWEARMADNTKVSAMIEALSTMMNAALDRKGAGMIPLSQEIEYVDAYLYIIHERLGDQFVAEKEIEPGMETVIVPRLILQPIVENAVEHDISPNGGGSIRILAYRRDGIIYLETIHSGHLSEEDKLNISRIMNSTEASGQAKVGLQNVAQRLKLIYGSEGRLSFVETDGMITIRLSFPEPAA